MFCPDCHRKAEWDQERHAWVCPICGDIPYGQALHSKTPNLDRDAMWRWDLSPWGGKR